MKSRTSFFNGTVLKKDLTRFAPVWVLYTVFLLLCLMLLHDPEPGRTARHVAELFSGMSTINLLYAGLCAAMLFGDLFNPRLCNALHALPMRREGWFLTHVTAGLLFCLLPCGFVSALCALLLQQHWYIALLWLALTAMQFVFFFGVGALSALCAGNRFATCGLYAILNFLSYIIRWFISIFYEPLLYGVVFREDFFRLLCPVAQMVQEGYVNSTYGKPEGFIFKGITPELWQYLGLCAGVGVALLVLAVLLYRCRKLESAGDFIAVRGLSPVFLVIYTLGVGAVMYTGADLFAGDLQVPFLIVGIIVGFFTGRMLLERRVNIFRGKTFLGFLLLAAVLGASVVLTWLDPLGITRYIPETSQVESLSFYSDDMGYYGPGVEKYEFVYTEKEDVDNIRAIHRQLLTPEDLYSRSVTLTMEYRLKNGFTITRSYRTHANSEAGKAARTYLSRWECVFNVQDWEAYTASVTEVSGDVIVPEEAIPGLLEAIRADCEAGTMVQDWSYHTEDEIAYWLMIYSSDYGYYGHGDGYLLELRIYDSCSNTIAYLKEYAPPTRLGKINSSGAGQWACAGFFPVFAAVSRVGACIRAENGV